MAADSTLPNEVVAKSNDELRKSDQIRQAVADTYTFVRSREINKTIASFTLDHYIDEAKRLIKGDGRKLRDASGEDSLASGTRPTKLEQISKIKQSFDDAFDAAKTLAKKADKGAQGQ